MEPPRDSPQFAAMLFGVYAVPIRRPSIPRAVLRPVLIRCCMCCRGGTEVLPRHQSGFTSQHRSLSEATMPSVLLVGHVTTTLAMGSKRVTTYLRTCHVHVGMCT